MTLNPKNLLPQTNNRLAQPLRASNKLRQDAGSKIVPKIVRGPSNSHSFLKFAFMPEFGRSFKGISFAWDSFINIVVQLFISAGLVNKDFIKQNPNIKLKNVIHFAYKSLIWDKRNLPKIIMFFAIMGFLIFMILAVITIFMQLVTGVAMAQGHVPTPTNSGDELLNSLFDITQDGLVPKALGKMLAVYSKGMLILGGVILLALIISVVAETAQSGVPFGKNFNHTWAPIRLVFAIGLLIPLSSGLNSGQYIVLNVAKWGSTLAGNSWKAFVGYTDLLSGDPSQLWTGSARDTVNNILAMELCKIRMEKGGHTVRVVPVTGTANNVGASPGNLNVPSGAGPLLSGNRIVYDEIQYQGDTVGTQTGCGKVRFPRLQRMGFSNSSIKPNDYKIVNAVDDLWADTSEYLMHARFAMYQNAQPLAQDIATAYVSTRDSNDPNFYKQMPPHIANDYQKLVSTYSDSMDMHAKRAMAGMHARIGRNLETENESIRVDWCSDLAT